MGQKLFLLQWNNGETIVDLVSNNDLLMWKSRKLGFALTSIYPIECLSRKMCMHRCGCLFIQQRDVSLHVLCTEIPGLRAINLKNMAEHTGSTGVMRHAFFCYPPVSWSVTLKHSRWLQMVLYVSMKVHLTKCVAPPWKFHYEKAGLEAPIEPNLGVIL